MVGTTGQAGPSRDPLYVFLSSSPYSGSTLLSFLMGEHPDISTTSDVSGQRRSGRMDTFLCSCGRLMLECPFWVSVAEKRREADPAFELGDFRTGFDLGFRGRGRQLRSGSLHWNTAEHARDRALRTLWRSHQREMQQTGARTQALAETVMAITRSRVFLDASKERLRARYLTRYLTMEVRVVHLVRDPRGVANSALNRHAKEGETIERAARRWVSAQHATERILGEVAPKSWTRVRYEDLCADVEGTMRKLYVFCGVDPDKALPEPPEQHLLGNKMRLQGHQEIRLDERWRSSLSTDQQQLVLDIAGPTMERLGLSQGAPSMVARES